jgi:hypothetical protein
MVLAVDINSVAIGARLGPSRLGGRFCFIRKAQQQPINLSQAASCVGI